ncbi:MEMO1 family [Podospora appendiculata]|uniref:MEMO1 family n=1 Tax=Podospora appendiculata TaxID=314037 RepID=A0AAE0XCX2_9PEZI|nr:MEMO1 family [Podospora appendiculata]
MRCNYPGLGGNAIFNSASELGSLHASSRPQRMPSSLILWIKHLAAVLFRRTGAMRTRQASHAGSWYEASPTWLSSDLDKWLAQVPDRLDGDSLPVPGARVIIAPHAGYSYSGPCAAWAYKALDLRGAKRVFVLGPSHTYYLRGCALTSFGKYRTPFGDLVVDREVTEKLDETGDFQEIPDYSDVEEHSLEMHLPYLWKRLQQTFGNDSSRFPLIVPILVGDLAVKQEKHFGQLLAPYLKDPENAFIISSDFCHWGKRFHYRPIYYADGVLRNIDAEVDKVARGETAAVIKTNGNANGKRGAEQEPAPPGILKIAPISIVKPDTPIHEFIKTLDDLSIDAVKTGVHDKFFKAIHDSGNTVCGRHPIGVVMAGLEALAKDGLEEGKGRFEFVQYQRSNLVSDVKDFSVSYASAYAII